MSKGILDILYVRWDDSCNNERIFVLMSQSLFDIRIDLNFETNSFEYFLEDFKND